MLFGNNNDNCGGEITATISTKQQLTIQSIGKKTVEIRVSASNVGRNAKSTERVFLIERASISPTNGSSAPLHPSTLIDEHSIGGGAISDQNSLECTGSGLRGKERRG